MTISMDHEMRVGYLTTMALLARCGEPFQLDLGLRPDVTMASHSRRRLFVGDAKATESATCEATRHRLLRYVTAAATWQRLNYSVRIAICARTHSGDWAMTLAELAMGHLHRGDLAGDKLTLDPYSEITWIDLPRLNRSSDRAPNSAAGDTQFDLVGRVGRAVMLPDPYHEPASRAKTLVISGVRSRVAFDLAPPPQRVRLRRS